MQNRRRWALAALAAGVIAVIEDPALGPLRAADTQKGPAPTVQWRLLRQLDLTTGEAPADLKKIDNTTVRLAGYMVPLESDDQEEADEYLIVPIAGGCIHTPPPPPHQIVYCRMAGKKKVKVAMFEPNWFEGKFAINKTGSPYGAVAYQMIVANVEPYQSR
ncbi:MAG: DUF3299 domain-containing protein [Acidobacteriota bacterium]